jgi:peptidoglycan/LPS O-acetylase OafA/YrhL
VGPWVIFYLLTGMLILLLGALFYPAASVLRGIGGTSGQGPAILIPPAFLLLSFLGAFFKARRLGRRGRWVAAYGWLMGSCALALVLLYLYLKTMTGG